MDPIAAVVVVAAIALVSLAYAIFALVRLSTRLANAVIAKNAAEVVRLETPSATVPPSRRNETVLSVVDQGV